MTLHITINQNENEILRLFTSEHVTEVLSIGVLELGQLNCALNTDDSMEFYVCSSLSSYLVYMKVFNHPYSKTRLIQVSTTERISTY